MGKTPQPPPPGPERRRSARVELLAQVPLQRGDGEVYVLPIVNISWGGAFLRLEHGVSIPSLTVGDQVSIFLELGAVTLDLDAVVLRLESAGREAGIGLKWSTPDQVERLEKA